MNFSNANDFASTWNDFPEAVLITGIEKDGFPIIYANSAATKITGYSYRELTSMRLADLDSDPVQSELRAIESSGKDSLSRRVNVLLKSKNRSPLWTEICLSSLQMANSNLIFCLLRDINENFKIREQFAETSQLLSSVVDNLPGVVYQWIEEDGHGRFTYVSDKLLSLFDIDPSNFKELPKMIHPDDLERWRRSIDRSNRDGSDWFFEGRFLYPDGTIKWWQGLSKQIRNSNGRITYNGIMLEISEKKNLERALSMEQERLQASAKMISLGEMSAGVAHEINNPLSVISGNAGIALKLLQKSPPEIDKAIECTEKIQKMSDRIAKIVKSLKLFARDDEKDPMTVHSVNDIVSETLEMIKMRLQKQAISLKIEQLVEARVWCRPVQLSQVILNLLTNAIDAIESTDVEAERWISMNISEVNGILKIRICDSGPGIPEAVRSKIMNPFFTTKEVGKGTGLGLSLSKSIAEDHGGTLFLENTTPNTCFLLELPLAE